jgi:uncharacterized protein YecE (DUF72 family)
MDRSQSMDFMMRVNHEMTTQKTKSKTAVIITVCTSAVRAHVRAILFQTPMIRKEETQYLRTFSDSWTATGLPRTSIYSSHSEYYK